MVAARTQPRIVVLVSADAEWRPVKSQLAPSHLGTSPYGEFFSVMIEGAPVLVAQGGWGKVAAAASTEYAIGRWQPDVLINLGTCGGIDGRVNCYDRLLATRTVIHDICEAMGNSAEALQAYATDVDLSWLGGDFPVPARRITLVSGDADLVPASLPQLLHRFPDMLAADWESGAIAYVARLRGTRLIILRAVSDLTTADPARCTAITPASRRAPPSACGCCWRTCSTLFPSCWIALVDGSGRLAPN